MTGRLENRLLSLRHPWTVRGIVLLGFLGLWQVIAEFQSPLVFATPGQTAVRLAQIWVSPGGTSETLPQAIILTLQPIAVGFLIAVAIGIPVGLLMGISRIAEYSIDPYVSLLYATPLIVTIPIVAVTIGSSMEGTYAVVILGTVFPIIINVMNGVKNVNKDLVEAAASFGVTGSALWRRVVFPSALPYTMAGVRIGIGHAVIGAILAEMFMYSVGLGYLILEYTSLFDAAAVIGTTLVVILIGIAITEGAKVIERMTTPWAKA